MHNMRVHAYFSGRVHGVFFRETTVTLAKKLGLTGWVRNTSDGRVELIAEGEETVLWQLLEQLRNYRRADVLDCEQEWGLAQSEFVSFERV